MTRNLFRTRTLRFQDERRVDNDGRAVREAAPPDVETTERRKRTAHEMHAAHLPLRRIALACRSSVATVAGWLGLRETS